MNSLGANNATDIFNWDINFAGARYALLNKAKNFDPYKQAVEDFMCHILPNNPLTSTKYAPSSSPSHILFMSCLNWVICEFINKIQYDIHNFLNGKVVSNFKKLGLVLIQGIYLLTTYGKYMVVSKHSFNCCSIVVILLMFKRLARQQVSINLYSHGILLSYLAIVNL
ncbi:Endoglucanase 9 [Bienertia sinuspersici]